MAQSQLQMVKIIGVLAALTAVVMPMRGTASTFAPRAKAGIACPGAVHSPRAVGDALTIRAGEPDVPGAHGNEIRQIYRLTMQDGHGREQITGWLYRAFDDRWAFSSTDPKLTGTVLNILKPKTVTTASIVHWVKSAAREIGVAPTMALSQTLKDPAFKLHIDTCFDPAWNGAK